MKTHKLILTGVLTLVFSFGFSQKIKVRRANSNYHEFAYIKTSEVLLDVANEGYKSVTLLQKLGDSYYFNNQMEDAAKWYNELMSMEEESQDSINAEYYFRYAQALKTTENYTEADKWMKRFNAERSDDLRSKAYMSNADYLEQIDNLSRNIEVENLEFNSPLSDFGAAKYNEQLVFASSRGKGKIYQWNEQPFLDLYTAIKQEDGTYGNPLKMNDDINSKYHESSAAYTPNGQFMFFTRNNFYRHKYRKDEHGVNRLKLFRATLNENGEWDDIVPIHFNSNEYSVAHPTINKQGTKLYFASDMPGTTGLSDIYVVNINEDGTLGTPKNISNKINTQGQESFPFINNKGDLYFSSNGYAGLGGLDIYVIKDFENKSTNHIPQNIGKPFNSPNDDFGFYENFEAKEGFFTSNREGGKGDDDIYSFTPSKCKQIIEGIVKDKDTKALIANANVILLDKDGVQVSSVTAGQDATFKFEATCNTEYVVRAEKETYISDEKHFTTISKKQELNLELLLDKDEQEITIGDDLAKVLDIPIIYFDFDKSNIRQDAAIELQKIIAVMTKYPNMKIDVRSHTDSRAPNDYNMSLSSRRNKSTIKYIVEKGNINASRLTGKGYGETQLINDCVDGKSCSEKEHQANRRSEFIIVNN